MEKSEVLLNSIEAYEPQHVEHLTLQNEFVAISVCPDFGGKLTSIKSQLSGIEFLKQPIEEISDIEKPQYGSSFLPPYSFGFDECFPTITSCDYELNGEIIKLPDHGEVWSRKWRVNEQNSSIYVEVEGEQLDYKLTRKITLHKNLILITYVLENTGVTEFEYLWSCHPLLSIEAFDEILLPFQAKEAQIYYSTDEDLERYGSVRWPLPLEDESNCDVIPHADSNFALKIFFHRLAEKKAGLYRKRSDQSIIFDYSNANVDELGIWMNYGGWPLTKPHNENTVALEPTTARTDSLSEAIETGSSRNIKAGQSVSWALKMVIEEGHVAL